MIKLTKIVVELGGKELILSLEDARQLHADLSQIVAPHMTAGSYTPSWGTGATTANFDYINITDTAAATSTTTGPVGDYESYAAQVGGAMATDNTSAENIYANLMGKSTSVKSG